MSKVVEFVKNMAKMVGVPLLGYGLTRMHDKHSRRVTKEDQEEAYKMRSKYSKKERKRRMKDYVKYAPQISAIRRKSMQKDLDILRSERKKDRSFTYRKVS